VKFTLPREHPPTNRSGGAHAYDKAAEAAIERKRSQYIKLICGHFTTWEDDQRYSFARPSKDKIWCEKCDKWNPVMPREKRIETPDEPLF
jgi:hypothetical protein